MRLAITIFMMAMGVMRVFAQDTWVVEQKCMANLNYPIVSVSNWDFSGVIISSIYPEGIHAVRSDLKVEYYLALESDNAYPSAGAISPDGKYFAYPVGETHRFTTTTFFSSLVATSLRVVRTNGNTDDIYYFDALKGISSGSSGPFNFRPTTWFGSNVVYYPNSTSQTEYLLDLSSDEPIEWTKPFRISDLYAISPDGTRGFLAESHILYDLQNNTNLYQSLAGSVTWFSDSSAFIIVNDTGISIFTRNGTLISHIDQQAKDIAIAPNNSSFAFWDMEGNLFLANIDDHMIYDLCFQGKVSDFMVDFYYPNLAWSPDNQSLAFSYDDYLVILNTQTLENQVIDHYSIAVMAWVPLN